MGIKKPKLKTLLIISGTVVLVGVLIGFVPDWGSNSYQPSVQSSELATQHYASVQSRPIIHNVAHHEGGAFGGAPFACTFTVNNTTSPPDFSHCPLSGGTYATDATNFIGQATVHPCGGSTFGNNGPDACGQEIDFNNFSGGTWSTTESANSAGDWQVVENYPSCSSCSVEAFPSAWPHGYNGVVSAMTTLTSSWNESFPHNANTQAHAMQDDWFYGPSSSNVYSDEMMIQYDFSLDYPNNQCPTGGSNNWDITARNVTFPGSSQVWYLCDGADPRFVTNGTQCPYATGTIGGGGFHCAVVWKPGVPGGPPTNIPVGSANVKAMEQWLETHYQPGTYAGGPTTYFPQNSKIGELSQGWEIISTNGINATFTSNAYTVDCVGDACGGSGTVPSVPTSATFSVAANNLCVLNWAQPSSAGSSAVTGYTVAITGSNGSTSNFVVGASKTIFKGASGTKFTALIAANNSEGTGPYSTAVSCTNP